MLFLEVSGTNELNARQRGHKVNVGRWGEYGDKMTNPFGDYSSSNPRPTKWMLAVGTMAYPTQERLPCSNPSPAKWFSPATPAVTSPLPRGVHGSFCLGGYQRPRAVDGISTLRCVRSITLSADCSADILRRLYAELKVEERDWLVPAPDRSRVAQVGSVPHAP